MKLVTPLHVPANRVTRGHGLGVGLFAVLLLMNVGPCRGGAIEAQSTQRPAPAIEQTVDTTIAPGDDFFRYANGEWLRSTVIPAGAGRWGARDEIRALTKRRVGELLDAAGTATAGSTARKVADFRRAYLNEAAIEAHGLAPIQAALDSIGRLRNRAALTRFLGGTMPADVDPLNLGTYQSSRVLGFAVERSIHGERTYGVFLVQGGLGLGDREQYLGTGPALDSLRREYQEYLAHMLGRAGFGRPTERAAGVMALETAIARTHATEAASASDRNADTRWTRADFEREAPGLDWPAFFDAAALGRQVSFTVWQPSAVTGLAALVASQPLEVWKDYLRARILDHCADLLPHAFADESQAVHRRGSRRERAMTVTDAALGEAIGRMYAERYFLAPQKVRVQTIVRNVAEAFGRRIAGADWFAPASRVIALAKIRSLYVGIGYPERWQDYADLVIDPNDPVGNLRRVEARTTRRALARVGRAADQTEWWIPPHLPGAVLIFHQNAYEFPAALLQPPKYGPAMSDAAAYGSIGAVIGHDISHFVDLLGAEYDTSFAMRHWWTVTDLARFKARAARLDEQFSGYRPFGEPGVNGERTERENVADLAGLESAFDAYRAALGGRARDRATVHRQDREFFIAFAQAWRAMIGDSAMRAQLASDDHAPEMFRVATVRNLDAWYDAFDVKPGQRLYLAPSARVHVW